MSNHTPGPWPIEYDCADESHGGQWYMVGPAKIWFSYMSDEETKAEALANARLISSSPDLLSSLERLLAAAPAFRSKPIGAEGSEARKQQEEHIAAEDAARELLAKLTWNTMI